MSHRIREAMRDGKLAPMGGNGSIVEIDETYHGKLETPRTLTRSAPCPIPRAAIPALPRSARSFRWSSAAARFAHSMSRTRTSSTVTKIVNENLHRETRVHTDESRIYGGLKNQIAEHQSVKHAAGEYVRGDVHSNTVESYFSIFKRGMRGTYQHCAEKNLHRYLAEFDFRHNARIGLGVTIPAAPTACLAASSASG